MSKKSESSSTVLSDLDKELTELEKDAEVMKNDLREREAELDKSKEEYSMYKKDIVTKLRLINNKVESYRKAIRAVTDIQK